jgi:Tfp pilus assembly protein PilF
VLAQKQTRPVAALTMLGILAQVQGDTAGAQQQFERAMEIDPRAPIAANNLAWLYAERGENLDRALQLAQEASRALPNSAEIQDTLGWVYYKRKTADGAVSAFEQTVKLAPREAIYHYHLGLAYVQDGNPVRARESLERALTLDRSFDGAADARRLLSELPADAADKQPS